MWMQQTQRLNECTNEALLIPLINKTLYVFQIEFRSIAAALVEHLQQLFQKQLENLSCAWSVISG